MWAADSLFLHTNSEPDMCVEQLCCALLFVHLYSGLKSKLT